MFVTEKRWSREGDCSLPEVVVLVDFGDSGRVRIALSDSTHVHTALNLEVAIHAPASAPRVLDEPVGHT